MNNKLLSICIPTYNRVNELKISLSEILNQAAKYQDKIEVIVSNNASTDETEEVLNEFKSEYPFLKVYKNDLNIGFNLNFFRLSDEYATGKYFWLIGDDDVIDYNAVEIILQVLEDNQDISFIGLNFRVLSVNEIAEVSRVKIENDIKTTKMYGLLNEQCRAENLLGTFISCNIILLDKFKTFDKSIFSSNSWNDYKSLFPHAHMMIKTLTPDEDVVYIKKPLLSVMVHEKEWDDKLASVNLYYILDVYKCFMRSNLKKRNVREVKKMIIKSGIGALFISKSQLKYKWNFLRFSLMDFYFYEMLILKSVNRIIKK